LEGGLVKQVCFVDDDQIGLRTLTAREGRRRNHLDRLLGVGLRVVALHDADAMNAVGSEGGNSLVDQAQPRDDKGDALSLTECALDDLGG
jgi:hypothetical protein